MLTGVTRGAPSTARGAAPAAVVETGSAATGIIGGFMAVSTPFDETARTVEDLGGGGPTGRSKASSTSSSAPSSFPTNPSKSSTGAKAAPTGTRDDAGREDGGPVEALMLFRGAAVATAAAAFGTSTGEGTSPCSWSMAEMSKVSARAAIACACDMGCIRGDAVADEAMAVEACTDPGPRAVAADDGRGALPMVMTPPACEGGNGTAARG
jgi:hypothetical protein